MQGEMRKGQAGSGLLSALLAGTLEEGGTSLLQRALIYINEAAWC